ncbi:MAG: tetratricopeptide repeat protein [Fibrobacteraceae bacterium]|nr:tetratricopeptide repeat protein [Fibrobacteraceae bacterium]
MRFALFLLLAFVVTVNARPINDGNKLFAVGDYEGALKKYMEAREAEPANPLLFYNIGTCQYKLGNYEEAKKELESALRMPDKKLSSKAAYNLANTYFRTGEKSSEPSARIEAWRQSVAYLKKAIDMDNQFENAKKNVEIVSRKLKEELDKQKENKDQNQDENNDQKQPPLSERAKESLARALQLSKEGKYAEAKSLLEQTIAEDETAGQLNAYVQRIDDVIEIKAGRKPKANIDASNTDNDLEVI